MAERRRGAGGTHPDEDLLVEVALGHADASDREDVAGHLALCAACRKSYLDLAGSVELVLPAIPRVATPPTFEARVLDRLAQEGQPPVSSAGVPPRNGPPRNVARRTVLWAAAAAVLGVAAGAGATAYLGQQEEAPAAPWAAALITADGTEVGRVSPSHGEGGALLVVEVEAGPAGRRFTCRLRHTDGSSEDVAVWSLADDRPNSWVVADPGPGLAAVELVAEGGVVWASAQL